MIANAIDALSARALETFAAPKAKTRAAFHAAWLERALHADALTIGWLAKTLRDKLEVRDDHSGTLSDGYARTRYHGLFERLEALSPYVSDPRVSSALCAVFEDMPFTVWDRAMTMEVYAPIAAMLIGCADVRVGLRLRAVLDEPRGGEVVLREVAGALLPGIINAVGRVPTPALVDESTWRAIVTRQLQKPEAHESVLLTQALTDDAARGIYADALIERGDTRGQFIALQLDGSKQALTHANALLRKHGAEWLGPLYFVLRGLVFERGFLVEAELAQNSAATPEVWSAAARDEQLATIRRLHKGRGSVGHLYDFYAGGALRALRCFEVPNHDALEYLPAFKSTVREVVLFERFSLEYAGALAALPLDAVTVSGNEKKLSQWVDTLTRHQLLSRLKRLTCLSSYVMSFAGPLSDDRLWAGALECFEVPHMCRLQRVGDGFELDFSSHGAEALLAFLQRFPRALRRVRCVGFQHVQPLLQTQCHAAAGARGVRIESVDEWPEA